MKKINSHWYNLSSNCTLKYFKCFLKIDSFKTHKNSLKCILKLHFTDEKKWSLESYFPKITHLHDLTPKSVFTFAVQFSSVQLLRQSCPTLCNPVDCSTMGFPAFTNSRSLFKLMSIELVMTSNHVILCHPLLLPPSVFPSTRVFSNESVLRIR